MIHSAMLKIIILLYLNNFQQNKHITTLFIAHMSILLMPELNHLVFLFLRRNLAQRKQTKVRLRRLTFGLGRAGEERDQWRAGSGREKERVAA